MFRHLITSINYQKLIEMQANQECGRLSKNEIKGQYKNPTTANQKKKVRKIEKK